jgi:hypothetical protein
METIIAEYPCIPTNAIINPIIWVYSMVLHAKNYVVLLKKYICIVIVVKILK